MAEQINWTVSIQVVDGPRISASSTLEVEAYDKIEVTIGSGTDTDVEVQPGNGDKVKFLLITCDEYSEDLTYSVISPEENGDNGESTEADENIKLDSLQMLIGTGAVGLLDASPKTLSFHNGLDHDVSIQILVGRNVVATSEEEPIE